LAADPAAWKCRASLRWPQGSLSVLPQISVPKPRYQASPVMMGM
jgi:hypothetical protein